MPHTVGMKNCSKCLTDKPLEDFPVVKRNIGGRGGQCKQCRRTQEREHDRATYYQRYGLTRDEAKKLKAQVKACPICGSDGPMVIDHCHESGLIRGVICRRCNAGIGLLGDTTEAIERTLTYMKESTQWELTDTAS